MQYSPVVAFVREHARGLLRFGWNATAGLMVGVASWWALGLPWAKRECPAVAQHWIVEAAAFVMAGCIYAVWLASAVLIVTYIGAALARKAAP